MLIRLILIFLVLHTPLFSEEKWPHFDYGKVRLENSGKKEAQEAFIQGLAALHSFEYHEAIIDFKEAQRIDPDFALAYWGEAMSNNHAFWRVQNFAEARRIMESLGKTPEERIGKAKLPFEKDLMRSLELLFGEGNKKERDEAYSDYMQKIYEKYPGNLEAISLYALSILGTIQPGDTTFRSALKAAGIIDTAFGYKPSEEMLNHPGMLHYFIHALDDPIHAPLALKAADRYALVVPDASHALHMPSHIYTQLGLWEKSRISNNQAYEASIRWVKARNQGLSNRDYHSFYWLDYACLQLGKMKEAKKYVDEIVSFKEQDHACFIEGHWALMCARYIIETEECFLPFSLEEVKTMQTCRVSDEPQAYSYAYAQAFCLLKKKEFDNADTVIHLLNEYREEMEKLLAANDSPENPEEYLFRLNLLQIQIAELLAIRDYMHNDTENALIRLKEAVKWEMAQPLPNGLPVPVQSSLELYGNYLLDENQWEEAIDIFKKALDRMPNKTRFYVGIAKGYEGLGNHALAKEYADRALKIWKGADSSFPALEEAKRLSQQTRKA